jgi:hypothetical protein
MASTTFLTPEEIAEITSKQRQGAQRRVLNALGISHKVRPDGSLVILRSHVERQLGGNAAAPAKKEIEPNWEALDRG